MSKCFESDSSRIVHERLILLIDANARPSHRRRHHRVQWWLSAGGRCEPSGSDRPTDESLAGVARLGSDRPFSAGDERRPACRRTVRRKTFVLLPSLPKLYWFLGSSESAVRLISARQPAGPGL